MPSFNLSTIFLEDAILKEYWQSGGKKKRIVYGDPAFLSRHWPDEDWPWCGITNPRHPLIAPKKGLSKTDLLRQMVRDIFTGM